MTVGGLLWQQGSLDLCFQNSRNELSNHQSEFIYSFVTHFDCVRLILQLSKYLLWDCCSSV